MPVGPVAIPSAYASYRPGLIQGPRKPFRAALAESVAPPAPTRPPRPPSGPVLEGTYKDLGGGRYAFSTPGGLGYRLSGVATAQFDAKGQPQGFAIDGTFTLGGRSTRVTGRTIGQDKIELVTEDGVRVLADLKVGDGGRFSISNPKIVNPLEAPLPGALYGKVSLQEDGRYALEAPGLKATFDAKTSTMEGTLALGDKTLSFKGRVTGERTMEAVLEDGRRVTFNVEVGSDGRFVFYNPRMSGPPAPLDLKA